MTYGCPSDEDLAAIAEANVLPEERLRIEAHLSRCSTCREIVDFVIRMNETIPEPLHNHPADSTKH